MSLYTRTQYQYYCDKCGKSARQITTGYNTECEMYVNTESDAISALGQEGWKLRTEPHLCPECAQEDEE